MGARTSVIAVRGRVGVACGKAIEDLGEAGGAPGAPRLTRMSTGRDGRWPSGDVAPWTR